MVFNVNDAFSLPLQLDFDGKLDLYSLPDASLVCSSSCCPSALSSSLLKQLFIVVVVLPL